MEKGTETSSYEIDTKVKSLITSLHNRAIKDTSEGTLKSDDDDSDGGGNISLKKCIRLLSVFIAITYFVKCRRTLLVRNSREPKPS